MKLSDYINKLQLIIEEVGDVECVIWEENQDYDSPTEGWFKAFEGDGKNKLSARACTWIDSKGNKQFASVNDQGYIDCEPETVFVVDYISE